MPRNFVEEELGGERAGSLIAGMARRILDSRGILVTTHVNPDGDAIGSELALALGLRRLGKDCRVVNEHPAPEKYRFLDRDGIIQVLQGEPEPASFRKFDLGILLDTSEPTRTGRLEKLFFRPDLDRICLDHHPGPKNPLFAHHWVSPSSPSTGNLVLRLLEALRLDLDREIATALFVALATDTGWFRFANTTTLALRDAARFLDSGVEAERLYGKIYEEFSAERMILLGRLLAGIQLEFGGSFAWSLLDLETLRRSRVPYEELDGFSEQLKSIAGAEIVAMVVETGPGAFKVSLRSKGDCAVNGIAARFGGGGHEKAAGFRTEGGLQEILGRLLERVRMALEDRAAAHP